MLKSQLLQAFKRNDELRGSQIELVTVSNTSSKNSDYGLKTGVCFEVESVPGYHTTSKKQEGLKLAGNQERIAGDVQAYLSVLRGFDPTKITENSYLMISKATLYELIFLDNHWVGPQIIYKIYDLQETTKSKEYFQEYIKQAS